MTGHNPPSASSDEVPDRRRLRVFVSYAHDSDEHKGLVLQFCQLLRQHGINAWLDRYDSDERRDWYAWYLDEVSRSDYVLIVASPGYLAAGDGTFTGTRRGVQTEAAHLRDLLHADRSTWTKRLLPIVLPGRNAAEIPAFLQPSCASLYLISELTTAGITDLLRTITRQPAHPPAALGRIPELPPITTPQATSVGPLVAHEEPDAHPTMTVWATDHATVYQAGRDQHITGR